MLVIGVVGLIVAGLSLATTAAMFFGLRLPGIRRRPWNGMKRHVEKLASNIHDGFSPDVVVGIEGGGIFVGGLLVTNWSSSLGARDIPFYIQGQHYETSSGRRQKRIPDTIPDACISGKKVLLVDSLVYTGDTMDRVKAFLQRKGPSQIKTAVVIKREGAAFEPDFHALYVSDREMMPWAFTEEYKKRYGKWE